MELIDAILEFTPALKKKLEKKGMDTDTDDYEFQQRMAESGREYCD